MLFRSEQADWSANHFNPTSPSYVKGTNWVIVNVKGGDCCIVAYDSGAHLCPVLYYKYGTNLNGGAANWLVYSDTNLPPPTTICPQIAFSQSFTVAAGALTNISIPPAAMMVDYDVVETAGIHITASQPVSVYGFDYHGYASAAFTGYPTTLLGTNYCIIARESCIGGFYSQLGFLATADNTTVKITPSPAANLAGYPGTDP